MAKDFPGVGIEAMDPDNPSFDYGPQVIQFIRERDPSEMGADVIKLAAATLSALGLAVATI